MNVFRREDGIQMAGLGCAAAARPLSAGTGSVGSRRETEGWRATLPTSKRRIKAKLQRSPRKNKAQTEPNVTNGAGEGGFRLNIHLEFKK